ncbi:hypothetical protein E4K64_27895 [Bradyrhizobium frederickii]|uniref:Uncharacterized protein n=1 Tax=Bradyrhizobium frederickii TaxID=2560054 RepID=A0A4Y9NWK7_9BRAD|nr:hypothetical protein [Bradyrhizobium frederickii]TFV71236.1 hypothetical protein E4K64_27895 [Bradyrhizobium frederickii]
MSEFTTITFPELGEPQYGLYHHRFRARATALVAPLQGRIGSIIKSLRDPHRVGQIAHASSLVCRNALDNKSSETKFSHFKTAARRSAASAKVARCAVGTPLALASCLALATKEYKDTGSAQNTFSGPSGANDDCSAAQAPHLSQRLVHLHPARGLFLLQVVSAQRFADGVEPGTTIAFSAG